MQREKSKINFHSFQRRLIPIYPQLWCEWFFREGFCNYGSCLKHFRMVKNPQLRFINPKFFSFIWFKLNLHAQSYKLRRQENKDWKVEAFYDFSEFLLNGGVYFRCVLNKYFAIFHRSLWRLHKHSYTHVGRTKRASIFYFISTLPYSIKTCK